MPLLGGRTESVWDKWHTGIRVEEEIRAIETRNMRFIIIPDRVRIEQLASVIRVVSRILHPQRQPVLIIALRDELGIPAIRRTDIRNILIYPRTRISK
jgi:hypothetical protein